MITDRPGQQFSDFFRKLRARSLSSWDVAGRVPAARRATMRLAELGWRAEHPADQPVPEVPDLGRHALADQLEVLTVDALRGGAPTAEVSAVLEELAGALHLRLR